MAALDQILDRQARQENTQLAQADHDNQWAQTFASTPPVEVLRASRNVAELTANALEKKRELIAQTSAGAMQVYAQGKKLEEFERQAPLRDELLRSKINAQGAGTRFQAWKEAQTQQQTARFFDGLMDERAPKPGTSEYQQHITKLLRDNPAFTTTAEAKTFLAPLAAEHDAAVQLGGIVQAPEGTQLNSVSYDKNGRPKDITFKATQGVKPPSEALAKLGELNADKANLDYYIKQEVDPAKRGELEKERGAIDAKIKGWHSTFQPQKETAVAAPVQDKKALAEQALNDPNASEAHKARARQILGK